MAIKTNNIFRTIGVFALFAALFCAVPVQAQSTGQSEHVKVQLTASHTQVTPGQTFLVAFTMEHIDHWHTYWQNPGDSGLATAAKWTLPEGVTVSEFYWPTPRIVPIGPLVNYGYEGTSTLVSEITIPENFNAPELDIKANLSWLVCKDICIPQDVDVSLNIPVGNTATAHSTHAKTLANHLAKSNTKQDVIDTTFIIDMNGKIQLDLPQDQLGNTDGLAGVFIPNSYAITKHALENTFTKTPEKLTAQIVPGDFFKDDTKQIEGLLVIKKPRELVLQVMATRDMSAGGQLQKNAIAPPPGFIPQSNPQSDVSNISDIPQPPQMGLFIALAFALAGGIILNLMPCVLPVLGLKILGLTNTKNAPGTPRHSQKTKALAYTAGVLTSFAMLAGILMALIAAGERIGWGFQLQSPLFICVLLVLFFVMALSLSGFTEFGTSLTGLGQNLTCKPGIKSEFFTGVLATIVATPCTAPFMGAALGFALTQPPVAAMAVFLALGLGLALPYLLLGFVPALARFVPKPGAWMETFKQFMAFPLYLTCVWLTWVLSLQTGANSIGYALAGLTFVAFVLWLGKLGLDNSTKAKRIFVFSLRVAVLVLAFGAFAKAVKKPAAQNGDITSGAAIVEAKAFDMAEMQQLIANKEPLFLNFTAAWCITCLVNEQTTLSTRRVQKLMRDKNITYMTGDWTNKNPKITRILEKFGRSGVPLYVFYDGSGGKPEVLPQILTPSIVVKALKKIKR